MSGANAVNITEIKPGARLVLADGAVVEVRENPNDGVWVICEYCSHPTEPALVNGKEHPIFAQDISSLQEA